MGGRLGIFVRVVLQSGVLLGALAGVAAAQTGMCGSGTGVCVQTWRQDINLPTGSACIGLCRNTYCRFRHTPDHTKDKG
jgi:hypothetical protein